MSAVEWGIAAVVTVLFLIVLTVSFVANLDPCRRREEERVQLERAVDLERRQEGRPTWDTWGCQALPPVPRPAPGHTPARHITLDPRTCVFCGTIMHFGQIHQCGRDGADYRPERT